MAPIRFAAIVVAAFIAVLAQAQGRQSEKDLVAALFDKYVPYLNSVNTDALATEICAVPVRMPISGGRDVVLNTPEDRSKAWKSYLDGAAKNGMRTISLESVEVSLSTPRPPRRK